MGIGEFNENAGRYRLKSKFLLLLLFLLIFILAVAGRCVNHDDSKQLSDKQQTGIESDQNINDESAAGTESTEGTDGAEGNGEASTQTAGQYDPANPYAIFEGALLIGDSRTEGMRMYSGITGADFFCGKSMSIDKVMGGKQVNINGSNMSVFDVLSSKQYTRIYICLGMNELGWVSVDDFCTQYQQLLDKIKELQPDAECLIELLFPVTTAKSEAEKDKVVNNERIYFYNTKLIELANNNGIRYLNPDAPLIDENGALKAEATSDGVHINSEYCKKWAEYLAQITYN